MLDSQAIANYQAPSDLLDGKIILVTGASSGLGKCASLSFARHGATVILLGRNLSKLEAVYDEIEAYECPQPAIFPLNLESATEQDYQALKETLENEFGRLDGLLINAAELGPRTPIGQYKMDAWQKVMQVNVGSTFLLTKTLMPLLNEAKQASIVFTSSGLAQKGRAYWGAYSVSKAAAENMIEVLADELDGSSKTRVNIINPGPTRTAMRAAAFPAEDPETLKEPESIMNCYLYLMGEHSEHLNGIRIDI